MYFGAHEWMEKLSFSSLLLSSLIVLDNKGLSV